MASHYLPVSPNPRRCSPSKLVAGISRAPLIAWLPATHALQSLTLRSPTLSHQRLFATCALHLLLLSNQSLASRAFLQIPSLPHHHRRQAPPPPALPLSSPFLHQPRVACLNSASQPVVPNRVRLGAAEPAPSIWPCRASSSARGRRKNVLPRCRQDVWSHAGLNRGP